MVQIARARLPRADVLRGEAVPLPFVDGAFERLVTSHLYGHLLPGERGARSGAQARGVGDEAARFLAEARRIATELVVVDAARRPEPGAEQWPARRLDDGSEHRVYKRWFTGAELAAELDGGDVLLDGDWFVVVCARASTARVAGARSCGARLDGQ